MERKYLSDIINWFKSPNRKPLIVWGARQVGKSYLIKNLFADHYFKDNYIYIDCANDNAFTSFVINNNNVDDIISYLSIRYQKDINSKTLLIFDEAQECTPLVSALKYFCQDHKDIPVILTGSMVRIKLKRTLKNSKGDKSFLFPIGKFNELTIYPLNFQEYLLNRNKMLYQHIVNNFNKFESLDNGFHEMALKVFQEYLLLGGMPEVVDTFLKSESYVEALKVLKELYNNYLYDMELYQASQESLIRSKSVFNNIFTLLNRESKNFSPSLIIKNTRNRDFINPIEWLETAFLVNKSKLLKENVTLPLLEDNESLFRLYLSDIGMFALQSSVSPESFIDSNASNTLSGVFYENYVAVELINAGFPLYYWKGKNNAEFEFIIQYKNSIVPIDVKKSKGNLNSLQAFKSHNKLDFAIKISANNLGFDKETRILTVPYYMVFELFNKLK